MQYLGAKLLDLGIVREQQSCDGLWSVSFLAGAGVGRLRHQGDIEEALAVRRRRRWAARRWRGGVLRSFSGKFCSPVSILGASASVHRQSDSVRDGVLLVLPSVYFLREKWTPSSPRSSHPGNLNIISTSSIWRFPRASVHVAFGRISHIFIVTVDSDFPAQFALENLDIISTCGHMAVGGVFGGFDASRQFWEPSMTKSSLPSRAHHAN